MEHHGDFGAGVYQKFARSDQDGTLVRHALYAVWRATETGEVAESLTWLRTELPDYWHQRESLTTVLRYFARVDIDHWHQDATAATAGRRSCGERPCVSVRLSTRANLGAAMRKPELMLELLEEMSKDESGRLHILRRFDRERHHHVELLVDAGHAEWLAEEQTTARITNAGYDFLNAARNPTTGKKALSKFIELFNSGVPYARAAQSAVDFVA